MFNVDEDEGRTVDISESVSSLPSIHIETSGLVRLTPDRAPYQSDDLPESGTVLYHDMTPEPSLKYSQRYTSQDVSEERGLATIATTESSFATGGAMHAATPIPLSQSAADLLAPARMWRPLPAPLDMDADL